jgi:maltose-binding protein MalE
MKLHIPLKKMLLITCALLVTTFMSPVTRAADDSYSFKVHNTTKEKITKILVSEDGEKYGYFDIGDGIKPDETVTLNWDKTTNSQKCTQWFKAVWESGEEGKPVKFNFCEKGLELEF